MTDADDARSFAAGDAPLAFPRHLLPVEPGDDAEVVLEAVIPAPDDGTALRPRRGVFSAF